MSSTASTNANMLNTAMRDLSATSAGLSKQFGIVERLRAKLSVGFQKTALGSFALYGKAALSMVRNMAQMYQGDKEAAEAHERLTIAQRALHKAFLQFNPVLQMATSLHQKLASGVENNNATGWQKTWMWLVRITTYFLFFISSIALVVAAFVILDAHLKGADASAFDLNTRFETLNAVMAGLGTIVTGEGGASGWSMIAAAMLLGLIAAAAVSATFGGLILVLGLAAAAFRIVEGATGSVELGMMAAIATGTALVASWSLQFAALGPVFNFIQVHFINAINAISKSSLGASKTLTATKTGFVAGLALLAAGIYGMVKFATGSMEGWKAAFLGVFSAILIGVGLFLMGVAAIPAIIIAVVALAIASVYRGRDQIWAGLMGFWDWYSGTTMAVINWFIALPGVIATAAGNAWSSIKNAFFDKLDEGIQGAKDAFSGIFALGNAIFDGIYNSFADFVNPFISMFNDIPGVPNIALIEKREKGGPVTGGQPYIVGEKGPELFTPGSSGSITPNHELGGGQNITLTINVGGVTDRTDKRALAREIGDMLTQELRRTGGATTRGRF